MTQSLVDPSVANLDELPDVLFEALYSTLGSFEEAIAAANEVATLIPEGSTDWELRITFHADAYERGRQQALRHSADLPSVVTWIEIDVHEVR